MEFSTINISPVNMENRQKLGIRPGDTVRVWQKIQEKDKTRLQAFEGLVLARKHGNEPGATFTVRRVSSGVGIEKIFPLYSPAIDKIEIIKRAKVRRAKLYYIRDKAAKEIKRQMRRMTLTHLATVSEAEETLRHAQDEKERLEKEAKIAEEDAAKEEAAKAAESSSPEVSKETFKEEKTKKEETAKVEEVIKEKTDTEEVPKEEKQTEQKEEEKKEKSEK